MHVHGLPPHPPLSLSCLPLLLPSRAVCLFCVRPPAGAFSHETFLLEGWGGGKRPRRERETSLWTIREERRIYSQYSRRLFVFCFFFAKNYHFLDFILCSFFLLDQGLANIRCTGKSLCRSWTRNILFYCLKLIFKNPLVLRQQTHE